MSQENIEHDSKRKTDSKTCMPDVEEVSCETCFELTGNGTGDCRQTFEHTVYLKCIYFLSLKQLTGSCTTRNIFGEPKVLIPILKSKDKKALSPER